MKRREFLASALALALTPGSPAQDHSEWPAWCAVGDVSGGQAVLVSQNLQGGPMQVSWSTRPDLSKARHLTGPPAIAAHGFTSQIALDHLPQGQIIYYQVRFPRQAPLSGRFRTPPARPGQPVRFGWGGDVCGQGWGIDPARGGMPTFATLARLEPHFFLHSGDSIYADDPLPPQKKLDDGTLWCNRQTPWVNHPANCLEDLRGRYRYNLLDPAYRNFLSKVSLVMQWDDHEVLDNWDMVHHREQAGPALQAFLEYWPVAGKRLYRKVSYGPDLDLFILDLRSYRAPNSDNRQTSASSQTTLLGRAQLDWLKRGLGQSRATWKVIGGEMPIATYQARFGLDSWANGPGAPLGREFELAELLKFLRQQSIPNVLWLSADVHYAAALEYRPERAAFQDFLPFWEFIAGPLHAGTFPPALPLDPTFGPKMIYCAVPPDLKPNRPPSDGLQFFGQVEIRGAVCRVTLHSQDGKELFAREIKAQR